MTRKCDRWRPSAQASEGGAGGSLLRAVVLCGLMLGVAAAAPAPAVGLDFTPQLSFATSTTQAGSPSRSHQDVVPGEYFTPQLSFATSTTQAGAHPDLTIAMHKAIKNHCEAPAPPYTFPANPCTDLYVEQNLKRLTVHFPPGAVPDANAAPYCDLRSLGIHPLSLVETFGCTNEDALVGVVDVTVQTCGDYFSYQGGMFDPDGVPDGCLGRFFGETPVCPDPEQPPPDEPRVTYSCRALGYVYNERPREGEEGHLVVIWPRWPITDDIGVWLNPDTYDPVGGYTTALPSHISVRVRESDVGTDSIAELPDYMHGIAPMILAGSTADIVLTLFGSTGAERGHPLLTNPTFCDPQTIDADFLGYAHNAAPPADEIPPWYFTSVSGYGDGKTVTDSVGLQATGCDKVPYAPKLELKLDTTTAGQVPAIEATVTQPQGEATTESSTVTFPSSFKINNRNKATFCGDADIQRSVDDPDRDFCPDSSRIGTVEASSYVLPESEPPLKGGVYLKGLSGDSVEFSALLEGYVDLRFDAKAKLGGDLTLINRFENLPAVPLSRFVLRLEGGEEKGLMKNPKICGTETVKSVLESHSKKQATQDIPVEITGCGDPTLEVELSSRRKGQLTDLGLAVGSSGTAIRSVELRLARQLRWGARKRLRGSKRKRLSSAGTASFLTRSGERKVTLKAKRTRRGNLTFTPMARRTETGEFVATEVPGFSAKLFRTAAPAFAGRAKPRRAARQTGFALGGLPGDDLTAVELALRGRSKRRAFYLRNPTRCREPLRFVAFVETVAGRKLVLKDTVRLRGRGCGKRS